MEDKWTWETIADTLIKEFKNGMYTRDEKIPSENSMAARFHVSRTEIRRAYEKLKELGYVYSMQGCGSFFSGKKEKIRLSMSAENFTEKTDSPAFCFESRTIECCRIHSDPLIHAMLDTDPENSVYKITQLRLLDGEPAAIYISHLTEDLFPQIAEEGQNLSSIHRYVHDCGYHNLKVDHVQLTISSPTERERCLLNIKGYAPCLVLTRRYIAAPGGPVVEVAKTIYRSDRFIFEL